MHERDNHTVIWYYNVQRIETPKKEHALHAPYLLASRIMYIVFNSNSIHYLFSNHASSSLTDTG